MGTTRSIPLVERDEDLERVSRLLEAARRGAGGVLVIEAPPGVGKSTLLQSGAALAGRGTTVLSARGGGSAESVDFGVALRLLSPLLEGLPSTERAAVFAGHAARARPLLEGTEDYSSGGVGEASTLFVGLSWLTARLARDPLLIAVDDAHAVDLPTLSYLVHLEQMIEDLPVALLIATRPATDPARQRLLARLAAAPKAARISLDPLTLEGVASVAAARTPEPSEAFSASLFRVTGGNPFLLHELLREVERHGLGVTDADAAALDSLVPEGFAIHIAGRIAELPPECEQICRAVVIIGHGATLAEAGHLAGLGVERTAEAVDLLVREGILAHDEGLEFAHPLVGAALAESLPIGAASLLHRRAAEMFEKSMQPERVPRHLLEAPSEGQEWVVSALRQAARGSLAHADPGTAVAFLRRALNEPPAAEIRAEVIAELAGAEAQAGDPGVLNRFDHALRAAPAQAHGELLLARGQTAYRLGRLEEAANDFDRGLAVADPGSDIAHRLESEYCQVATLIPALIPEVPGRMERAIASIDPASAGPGGRAMLATASLNHGLWGSPREGVVDLAERALVGDGLIVDAVAGGNALFSVTASLTWAEDYERVVEVTDAAAAEAARRGAVLCWVTCSFCRGLPNLLSGRLREAIADCEVGIAGEARGWEQFLPAAHAWRAFALAELGELEAAERGLEELPPERWEKHPAWPLITAAEGRLLLERRKHAEALERFERWGELWPVPNPSAYADWRSHAALALIHLGERDRAADLASAELAAATGFGASGAIGRARRALGLALGGREGLEQLEQAVADLDRSPARLSLAYALGDLGASLRRGNRRADARQHLRRALDLAERLGARPLAGRVREELKMAGARPRSPWTRGVESLTPGELRVARMAASGQTNREIAEALFVTDRAIHWHLRNTYRKLGVNDRRKLIGLLDGEEPKN